MSSRGWYLSRSGRRSGLALLGIGACLCLFGLQRNARIDIPLDGERIDLSKPGTRSFTFQTNAAHCYEVSVCSKTIQAITFDEQVALLIGKHDFLSDQSHPALDQTIRFSVRLFENDKRIDVKEKRNALFGKERIERILFWFDADPEASYRLVVEVEKASERLDLTHPTIRVKMPAHVATPYAFEAAFLLLPGMTLGGIGLLILLAGGIVSALRWLGPGGADRERNFNEDFDSKSRQIRNG